MAGAHAVGTAAAFRALPKGGVPAPGQAARRLGTRCAPGCRTCSAGAAVPAGGGDARTPRRAAAGVRAIRLAARGAAGVAVRAGAENAGPGIGKAAHQTLAKSTKM